MPLVRIDLRAGKPPAYRAELADAVHQALVDVIGIPPDDRFHVITEHEPADLTFDPGYLGVRRDDDVVFVQITLRRGRTVEQKRGLYARIAELAALRPGVVPGNILVNLVEVGGEDWSFGDGVAQYAPAGG